MLGVHLVLQITGKISFLIKCAVIFHAALYCCHKFNSQKVSMLIWEWEVFTKEKIGENFHYQKS